jgi:3-hydroxyisobutyrate dehydrogenase
MSDRVGFVGLGQIGAPMATRLLSWPGGLTVFDARAEAMEPFAAKGADVAATPAELAGRASVISVMVRDDDQVRHVLTGDAGILAAARPGTVVAIHSTVEAGTPGELAELAAPLDVAVVDAPVSGGAPGAHEGTLAVMVGGDAAAVDLVRGPFEMFASLVAHVGPVGAGTRAKLARNLITFAAMAAAGEAQRLAEAGGVDLKLLGEVVRHSDKVTGGPGASLVRDVTAPLPPEDGLHGIFTHTRDLGEKDLDLALSLGDELGVDLPTTQVARDHLAAALGVPHESSPDESDDQASAPDRRERGKAMLRAVYGWDFEPSKPFERQTVDHLFGEVWADGQLPVRDRRLVLLGLCVGTGLTDVAGLQAEAALRLGELGPDDLRELVVLVAHYAGWPVAAKLNDQIEKMLSGRD